MKEDSAIGKSLNTVQRRSEDRKIQSVRYSLPRWAPRQSLLTAVLYCSTAPFLPFSQPPLLTNNIPSTPGLTTPIHTVHLAHQPHRRPRRPLPFLLPRRALDFYSPYLRTLISTTGVSPTLHLPNDAPAAFDVLVAWMNLDAAPAPCHQCATALDKLIGAKEEEGMRPVFKGWLLAKRLDGPCLVLRDHCTRYLYKEYAVPLPGGGGLVLNPAR